MGPRSNDRGNVFCDDIQDTACMLQWGRDQMIAEIHGAYSERSNQNLCFNGAAIK